MKDSDIDEAFSSTISSMSGGTLPTWDPLPHELQLILHEPTATDLLLCAGTPPITAPAEATVELSNDEAAEEVLPRWRPAAHRLC